MDIKDKVRPVAMRHLSRNWREDSAASEGIIPSQAEEMEITGAVPIFHFLHLDRWGFIILGRIGF